MKSHAENHLGVRSSEVIPLIGALNTVKICRFLSREFCHDLLLLCVEPAVQAVTGCCQFNSEYLLHFLVRPSQFVPRLAPKTKRVKRGKFASHLIQHAFSSGNPAFGIATLGVLNATANIGSLSLIPIVAHVSSVRSPVPDCVLPRLMRLLIANALVLFA